MHISTLGEVSRERALPRSGGIPAVSIAPRNTVVALLERNIADDQVA